MELFQGNIFYPARDTLAFSEPLIVPALLGAPVAWLGGSPVLVFNLLVLAGFALTAFAGYALIFAWTGDRMAAMLAGCHVRVQHAHADAHRARPGAAPLRDCRWRCSPTDRLLSGGRTRDAGGWPLWMTVMAYSSGYLLVFGAIMIAVVGRGAHPHEWLPRASRRRRPAGTRGGCLGAR